MKFSTLFRIYIPELSGMVKLRMFWKIDFKIFSLVPFNNTQTPYCFNFDFKIKFTGLFAILFRVKQNKYNRAILFSPESQ